MFKAPFFLSRFFAGQFWEKTEPNQASGGTGGGYFEAPFFTAYYWAARFWAKSPISTPVLNLAATFDTTPRFSATFDRMTRLTAIADETPRLIGTADASVL